MPPLSTHFRFATLIHHSLGIVKNSEGFFLGTAAPDAFVPDSEASFSQHHFKKENGPIDLSNFLQAANFMFQLTDDLASPFTYGYLCHLWLDVFYRENAERLSFKRPSSMSDVDMRKHVRRETEILNAPFVLRAGHLPIAWPEDLVLPSGLAFVDPERCVHLFQEVVKQSQEWSIAVPDFQIIDQAEYAAFLEGASRLFMNEIQAAT